MTFAGSLVVAAAVGVVVIGDVVSNGSDEPTRPIGGDAVSSLEIETDLAAEVERAGRQFDPVGPSAASTDRSGPPRSPVTDPPQRVEGSALAAEVAGEGSPGFPAVLPDVTDRLDRLQRTPGLAPPAWPEGVTCSFDDDRTSAAGARSVVVDRDRQRSWFCEGAEVTRVFPVTTARSQPDPGVYEVYAKDMHTSSTFGGGYSTMTHFVAFTRGKFQGARIAFHSVPVYRDGSWVQPLESVGSPDRIGESAGCIRALPDDAVAIWDWLEVGDLVRVIT